MQISGRVPTCTADDDVLAVFVPLQNRARANAKAASVNITGVDVGNNSYITVYPCGALPLTSNLNITPQQRVTANGAMVKLSDNGDLCLFSQNAVHLVVDINGVWL